jgi:hypothetical protein
MCSAVKNIMPKEGDGGNNNITVDTSGRDGGVIGCVGDGGNVHIGDRADGSHGK